MAKPVLAAINGICCGAGLDWITTGDIVIASERATFFDPHVSIGLVAGREMVRLARVLPRNVALRMAIMGKHERMDAQRAYDLGMITEIVEHDRLLERANEIADVINSNAPLAVRGTRLAIHKTLRPAPARRRDPRRGVPRTQPAHGGLPGRARKGVHGEAVTELAVPLSVMTESFETVPARRRRDHPRGHHHVEPARVNPTPSTGPCVKRWPRRWRTVKSDEWVNAVVLRAGGERAFSAGLDIKTPYGLPKTSGTTRILARCSARNGRRCGSPWCAPFRARARRARSTS